LTIIRQILNNRHGKECRRDALSFTAHVLKYIKFYNAIPYKEIIKYTIVVKIGQK